MEMHEAAGETAGQPAVHGLNELSIELGGIHRCSIFLHSNNRAGRPEGVLAVEITSMKQRKVFPVFLGELAEDIAEPREELRGPLWLIDEIKNALVMPTQDSVQIGGSDLGSVAYRKESV